MGEGGKIPARRDVAPEDTWALEDLYADVQDWEADCEKARQTAKEAAAMRIRGQISRSGRGGGLRRFHVREGIQTADGMRQPDGVF